MINVTYLSTYSKAQVRQKTRYLTMQMCVIYTILLLLVVNAPQRDSFPTLDTTCLNFLGSM